MKIMPTMQAVNHHHRHHLAVGHLDHLLPRTGPIRPAVCRRLSRSLDLRGSECS